MTSTFTDFFDRLDVQLFTIGDTAFTVYSAFKLVVLLLALYWIASVLRNWTVRRALARATHLDEGTRQAVGSIVRYAVLVIGFVLILQNVGINLSAFSVLAGALGVGVGFGLQNVFSNFISGVIIMFERPIKVGDRVELAGVEGTVREIGARRTTVVTFDNISILVPNQRFITDNVVNLAYADTRIRLRVAVSVAPGTDIALVERLLLEAAKAQPEVRETPPPEVLLTSLGTTSMGFEAAVWFDALGPTRQHLTSQLNKAIWQRLQAHQIRAL